MRVLDTSVTVPLLAGWHEAHSAALAAVRPDDRLPEHVALETYAVLTRLPPPLRLSATTAAQIVQRRFPPPYLELTPDQRNRLLQLLSAAQLTGGASYDGLVALTALSHGCVLLSRDARAATTYERLGVDVQPV